MRRGEAARFARSVRMALHQNRVRGLYSAHTGMRRARNRRILVESRYTEGKRNSSEKVRRHDRTAMNPEYRGSWAEYSWCFKMKSPHHQEDRQIPNVRADK